MREKFEDKFWEYIIVGIFLAIIFIVCFLEEEYGVTKYLWILNIIFLVTTPLYYFIHDYREKMKTRKIEKTTIIKNIDFQYYKDIIDEYSPAMLSLILDGLEFDKDLGASVIYLINKGYLEVREENKIIRTNKDCSKLPQDLQVLCNSDINHLLTCTRFYTQKEELQASEAGKTRTKWMESIEKQVVEKGLATEREDKSWKTLVILFVIGIIEAMFAMAVEDDGLLVFSGIMIFVLMFLRVGAFWENRWVKTQKGYELYTKVLGLKNYIKDYSNLSESELKEITIWEDYLIYAIILNNTSKLNKEAKDYYEKICDIRDQEGSKPNIKKSIKICVILSIIIPVISLIACLNEILPIFATILLSFFGVYLTSKGKEYNKTLTTIGYVMNAMLLLIAIFIVFAMWFYNI